MLREIYQKTLRLSSEKKKLRYFHDKEYFLRTNILLMMYMFSSISKNTKKIKCNIFFDIGKVRMALQLNGNTP